MPGRLPSRGSRASSNDGVRSVYSRKLSDRERLANYSIFFACPFEHLKTGSSAIPFNSLLDAVALILCVNFASNRGVRDLVWLTIFLARRFYFSLSVRLCDRYVRAFRYIISFATFINPSILLYRTLAIIHKGCSFFRNPVLSTVANDSNSRNPVAGDKHSHRIPGLAIKSDNFYPIPLNNS